MSADDRVTLNHHLKIFNSGKRKTLWDSLFMRSSQTYSDITLIIKLLLGVQ